MFEVGDFIVYGASGVCEVKSIGSLDIDGVSNETIFYTLIPKYGKSSEIFTPVDNKRIVMRHVMSEEQARMLLSEIKSIEELGVTNEKKREQEYKEAISTCDPRSWVSIIKTIYTRKVQRTAAGKKVTSSDMKYISLAEDHLYGELAVSLHMDRDKVKEYVEETVEKN